MFLTLRLVSVHFSQWIGKQFKKLLGNYQLTVTISKVRGNLGQHSFILLVILRKNNTIVN